MIWTNDPLQADTFACMKRLPKCVCVYVCACVHVCVCKYLYIIVVCVPNESLSFLEQQKDLQNLCEHNEMTTLFCIAVTAMSLDLLEDLPPV